MKTEISNFVEIISNKKRLRLPPNKTFQELLKHPPFSGKGTNDCGNVTARYPRNHGRLQPRPATHLLLRKPAFGAVSLQTVTISVHESVQTTESSTYVTGTGAECPQTIRYSGTKFSCCSKFNFYNIFSSSHKK